MIKIQLYTNSTESLFLNADVSKLVDSTDLLDGRIFSDTKIGGTFSVFTQEDIAKIKSDILTFGTTNLPVKVYLKGDIFDGFVDFEQNSINESFGYRDLTIKLT